jgi:hypothetical protein
LLDSLSDVYEYISNQAISNCLFRLQFKLDRELTGKRLSDDIHDVTLENMTNLIEAADGYIQKLKIQAILEDFLQISQ